jgi:DNA-binding NarL/FixJ family response regulator
MRVLLADDHAFVRTGLRSVLLQQEGVDIVAEERDGEHALAAIRSLRPEVAVLDIEMPGLSGIDIARTVTDLDLPTSVVLLSMHREESFVSAAFDAGVVGYILKEDAPEELVRALEAVDRNEVYLSRGLRAGQPSTPPLSPRQRDIVRLLARGMTNKEIATELGLTAKTVDGYRALIMDKLELGSTAQLVKYAIRNCITTVDE